MNQSSFNLGDHIYKIQNGIPDISSIYTILNIKEINGGNWHDGYTISYIATIQSINKDETNNIKEEYTLRFVNYMCQIDLYFVCKVNN
jgi:hypothetical protein